MSDAQASSPRAGLPVCLAFGDARVPDACLCGRMLSRSRARIREPGVDNGGTIALARSPVSGRAFKPAVSDFRPTQPSGAQQ